MFFLRSDGVSNNILSIIDRLFFQAVLYLMFYSVGALTVRIFIELSAL